MREESELAVVDQSTGEVIDAEFQRVDPPAPASWAPSALSMLDEAEFEARLSLAVRERARIAQVQRAVMREGIDYGVIPGTKKPTLLKPGAEILNKLAGFVAQHSVERECGDGITAPPVRYQVRTTLVDHSGAVVGEGFGSCSSWETKYRYRNAERSCPACGHEAIIKGREQYGGGWLCFAKKGGCGAKFPDNEPAFAGGGAKVDNIDPVDLDNTILKMSLKRADVDATLRAHAASGIFTQDVEDFVSPSSPASSRASAPTIAQKARAAAKPMPQSPKDPRTDPAAITPDQRTRLWTLAAERAKALDGVDRTDVVRDVLGRRGIEHTTEVPRVAYEAICAEIEKWQPPVAMDAGTLDAPEQLAAEADAF